MKKVWWFVVTGGVVAVAAFFGMVSARNSRGHFVPESVSVQEELASEQSAADSESIEPEPMPQIAVEEPVPEPTVIQKTVDDFNAADFFDGAVFSGDSVLSQFYYQMAFPSREPFGKSLFLATVSYGVTVALMPVSDTSIHPMYKGEQHQIWETMRMVGAKRAILFFGLNDIGLSGVDDFLRNYAAVIDKIREAVPGIKVYIISITPIRADKQYVNLNTPNILLANERLKEYCAANGLGYIDVATQLMDENGSLLEKYSDGTNVHETTEALQLWKNTLVQYAKEQLLAEYYEAQGQ